MFNIPRFPIAHLGIVNKTHLSDVSSMTNLGLTQLATTRYGGIKITSRKFLFRDNFLRKWRTDVTLFDPGSVTEAKDSIFILD